MGERILLEFGLSDVSNWEFVIGCKMPVHKAYLLLASPISHAASFSEFPSTMMHCAPKSLFVCLFVFLKGCEWKNKPTKHKPKLEHSQLTKITTDNDERLLTQCTRRGCCWYSEIWLILGVRPCEAHEWRNNSDKNSPDTTSTIKQIETMGRRQRKISQVLTPRMTPKSE